MKRCAVLGLAAALIAGACTSSSSETTTTAAVASTTSEAVTTSIEPEASSTTSTTTASAGQDVAVGSAARPRALEPFADFEEIPLLGGGVYPGPATPQSLDGVLLAPPLRFHLEDPAVAGTLAANGFVVVPGFERLFHTGYEASAYDPYPVFVTTDAAYHVWHLVFSKVLRELEEEVLLPELETLVLGMLDAARTQAADLAGSPLADHAARVVEWFEAAAALLGVEVGSIGSRASQEVELALDAARMTSSPVTSFGDCLTTASAAGCVDYTQFRPRGHYNRSADLQRYFRAMSLLGQSGFFLDQPDSLAMGVLVARLLDADPVLAASWERIYEPTAFLVGIADDYTPFEVVAIAADITPDGVTAPVEFADPAVSDELADRLLALRDVGINPEAAAMRVMGARFVVDSFILDQLTWPNVGEDLPELRRVSPSPLDVAAGFGSDFAYEIQEMGGETQYLHYDDQLDLMQRLLDAREATDWAATVYDAWLYALEPMWAPHGEVFPDFMRTAAWTAKAHQTGFASYTELKHDTILYAKQGFAAEGGFDPLPFEPRHWVEPDPVAFLRIDAVAGLAQDGLNDRGLLPEELDALLSDLREFVSRLARIAQDELAGLPISDDDNAWLETAGSWLEYLWLASSDIDDETGEPSSDDEDAAVVADIFRNTFEILEIGTGRIDSIYVLVPNDQGEFQVARGGVYSYYEFWQPASAGRLTDEEWRAMLDSGQAPERPTWQRVFLPGAAGNSDVALPAPEGSIYFAAAGLFCRDLNERGFTFADAVRYWWWDGRPDRMDADGNGVPCETVYPGSEVAAFPVEHGLEGDTYAGSPSGEFCRDLSAAGFAYFDAFQYWLWDGSPERMDADRNGIPCETVYESTDVLSVLNDVGWNT
jgi:hypothetical protein